MKLAVLALSVMIAAVAAAGESIVLEIEPQAIVELLPLAAEALAIQQRATEREAKHAEELKKKGIAEVPPCGSERYVIDTPAFGGFSFDDWGELYIDRRFVTDDTISYYVRFYEAKNVVAQALRDMKKGKDVSIHGKYARMQVFATKLVPHKTVMKIWCKQQKKPY